MAKKVKKASGDAFSELQDIKKLIMLKLLVDGVKHSQIANVLGIDQGNLSRMLPARVAKGKKS